MITNQNFSPHRELIDVEDRESVIIDNDKDENLDSDGDRNWADSGFSDNGFEDFIHNGMVKIEEGSNEHDIVEKSFLQGMGIFAKKTRVVAIHKNLVSCPARKARWFSFQIFTRAVAEKNGGNANIWVAWYGGSREEISQILSHGFSRCDETANGESHGVGIHLSPANFPINSVKSSIVDGNGVSHMLLCRVIMGKMEMIPSGSKQFQPSSTEFDSGVDNLAEPGRLIVWSAFMNSHIFPTYTISFKLPSFNGRNQVRIFRPTSPWMSFPDLMDILSKLLDHSKMTLILKSYDEFRKNKVSRLQLIQRVRQISGDSLLAEIIKSYRHKLLSRTFSRTSRNWHPHAAASRDSSSNSYKKCVV